MSQSPSQPGAPAQASPPPPPPPFGAPPPMPPPGYPGMPPPGGFPPGAMPPPSQDQAAFPRPGWPPAPGAIPPPVPPVAAPVTPAVPAVPAIKRPLNTTPSRTVYVSNLNEKVKLKVLKNTLRNMFSQYGTVLDVVAHSNIRMRGQAFVAFEQEESATNAIKELQHFVLYNKPMIVQYAKTKSDVHAKQDGSFEEHYRERMIRKEEKKSAPLPGSHKPTFNHAGNRGSRQQLPLVPDEFLPPNNILFLQNLPEEITQQQIMELFQRYPGFKEVRMVPTKKGIAFVEYESELQSSMAKADLSGFQFDPEHQMRITFARK